MWIIISLWTFCLRQWTSVKRKTTLPATLSLYPPSPLFSQHLSLSLSLCHFLSACPSLFSLPLTRFSLCPTFTGQMPPAVFLCPQLPSLTVLHKTPLMCVCLCVLFVWQRHCEPHQCCGDILLCNQHEIPLHINRFSFVFYF